MTAVILQARLDSSRLPRKALLDLCGKPIITRAMESLLLVRADLRILAVDHDSFEVLSPLAVETGFIPFAGPKNDVLQRFCNAIKTFGIDTVIRATGDNPLVSHELANQLFIESVPIDPDFSGYVGMPTGMGVEIIKADCLLQACRETDDPYCHEHVSPWLYRNPDRFSIFRPTVPLQYRLSNESVTVDTFQDYERVVCLFKEIYNGSPPSLEEIIRFLSRSAR